MKQTSFTSDLHNLSYGSKTFNFTVLSELVKVMNVSCFSAVTTMLQTMLSSLTGLCSQKKPVMQNE
jgi:hypothetical protein